MAVKEQIIFCWIFLKSIASVIFHRQFSGILSFIFILSVPHMHAIIIFHFWIWLTFSSCKLLRHKILLLEVCTAGWWSEPKACSITHMDVMTWLGFSYEIQFVMISLHFIILTSHVSFALCKNHVSFKKIFSESLWINFSKYYSLLLSFEIVH